MLDISKKHLMNDLIVINIVFLKQAPGRRGALLLGGGMLYIFKQYFI